MADRHSKAQRSKNMKAVKSKDSKIELLLRKELWNRGHRYRKHYKKIPGKPDIVFVGKKVAVFCDSEFWHGKNWNERKKDFKSNKKFWHSKIERNIERDKEVNEILENLGWTVLRFWGNQIKQDLDRCVSLIEEKLRNNE
ncbi:MAG: very short patch repair endonuclease [Balneola sp.]|nr:very short patch repair endonuclease [Balneola sp.]MBO6871498.1 very short patch repair endonuclease [Balneola sp.]